MAFNKTYGTLKTALVSLTPGAPSGVLFPAPAADEVYYIRDFLITTNDTAQPMITVSDASGPLLRAYVSNAAPTLAATSDPIRTTKGSVINVTAGAVTAAKTVEIKCVAYVSKT